MIALLLAALLLGQAQQPATPPAPQQHATTTDAGAAAAAGAAAGAVVAQQVSKASSDPALDDPHAFAAPDQRARQWFGYASPWTPALLALILVVLAASVNRLAPKKKRRIRRATILLMLYVTCFVMAATLHGIHAEGWSRRVWYLADLFEVLVVIDLVAILLFDLLLLALHIEVANIVHDLALGAAYILAFIGMMHRAGVQLSGIIATSAVVTAVLGLSLQATLANVLGGIALQLDDSISVNDWIQLPGGQQGKVKAIRWRHTVVETRNWDTIIVPNSSLLGENILILGAREDQPRQHRMWVYFHVDFRFTPDEVCRVVDEALQSAPIPCVAATPPAHCICMDLAQGAAGQGMADGVATYAVRYWLTDIARDDPTSSDIRLRIFAALKRANIPLAVPARAVFVSQDDKEHQERKLERELARRVSSLEAIEMFQGLGAPERMELARSMRFAPFGRGEVITRQAATAHWLYVLTKGEVEVKVRVDVGGEKLVTRMAAPNVFGEMGVMTGEPRTASVVAATEVECYRIDKEAFQSLVKGRPDLTETISAVMARRRVELAAVRENLDAEARRKRVVQEERKILAAIQNFFGLDEEA